MAKPRHIVPYLRVVDNIEPSSINVVEWAQRLLNGEFDVLLFGRPLKPEMIRSGKPRSARRVCRTTARRWRK